MLFTSYIFILSLPILILCYRILSGRWREIFLGVVSALCYLYFGVESLIATGFVSLFSFVFTNILEKRKKRRGLFLVFGISVILTALFLLKGLDKANIIGISYFSLMAIGYFVEVYRGKSAEKNLFRIWLCISFFPLMIQGPITDFFLLKKEILKEKEKLTEEAFLKGMERLLIGYFKKLVIADRLAPFLTVLFASEENTGFSFICSLLLYSIRLIMDFTGGIDIAIGIGTLMGIKIRENFHQPLKATSLADFWRRWHCSLSDWFSNYVFYPLSITILNRNILSRFSKKGKQRVAVYISTIITWSLTGLWHGWNLSFLVWGLSNAWILLFSYEWKKRKEKKGEKSKIHTKVFIGFQMARTFFIVSILRAFDLYREPIIVLKKLNSFSIDFQVWGEGLREVGLGREQILCLCLFFYYALYEEYGKKVQRGYFNRVLKNILVFLVILIFGAYGKGFSISGFVYGQF